MFQNKKIRRLERETEELNRRLAEAFKTIAMLDKKSYASQVDFMDRLILICQHLQISIEKPDSSLRVVSLKPKK